MMKSAVLTVLLFAGVLAIASPVSAEPFLCPIVGDGVLNADAHNGDHGVSAIQPPAGTSLLPGKNMAGANANPNAYNKLGGPVEGNNPGHNPGFTPIWNP